MARYSVKRKLNIDTTDQVCDICKKVCRGPKALKSHKTQMHSGPKDTAHRGRPSGIPAWNKGNRSKPDTRNPDYVGKNGGYRANAGRSKKFRVTDSFGKETTLQSSFEKRTADLLDELKIRWVRPKALYYGDRRYFADFYLVDYDVWLDPKNNYKAKQDAAKIQQVIDENKIRLFVLLEHQITKEYISSIV